MNEPQIQLPPLPVSDVNRLLEGLKRLPLGDVYNLFTLLFAEAQKQMQAPTPSPTPALTEAPDTIGTS